MKSILIRCDASLSIGSGHVMRCRTLARELQRRGALVTFLCRCQSGDLISLLEQDFAVLSLPELPLLDCGGLGGRDLYRAWLGCSQEQDALDCLQVLEKAGVGHADWLVVDHYGLDASWQHLLLREQAGETPPKLLVIDDLADRAHLADLLLDQNFFGEVTDHRYKGLVPPQCRQLLGPHYALLAPEYAQLNPLVPARTELSRVLVFFGGVDPANLTCRALKALMDPALAHLAVDVVLGRHSPHRQSVADLVTQRPLTTLHDSVPSLAGLIARADLAIGACGSTSWERIALRLPALVVTFGMDQLPIARALDKVGHVTLLGDQETASVRAIRSSLISETAAFAAERDVPCPLTDGFGAPRLALAMLGVQAGITLRPAVPGDEALLLRWANEPKVRASSYSPDLITPSDHHNWFLNVLADSNRLLFVAVTSDGCPIGQIRFDRRLPSTNGCSAEATVDLSLDRCVRGLGLAADVVHLGLQLMEQIWGSHVEAVAEVLKENQPSNNCFRRVGFVQETILSAASTSKNVNYWRFTNTVSRA